MARLTKGKIKKVKAKTHKSSAKRFKISATGKLKHRAQGDNGHAKGFQSRKEKSGARKDHYLASAKETRKIKRLLGQ